MISNIKFNRNRFSFSLIQFCKMEFQKLIWLFHNYFRFWGKNKYNFERTYPTKITVFISPIKHSATKKSYYMK